MGGTSIKTTPLRSSTGSPSTSPAGTTATRGASQSTTSLLPLGAGRGLNGRSALRLARQGRCFLQGPREQCAAGALHAGAFGPPWSPVLRSRVGERHGGLRDAACAALLLSGQPLRIFPRELEPRCPHGLQGGASALQRRPPGGRRP